MLCCKPKVGDEVPLGKIKGKNNWKLVFDSKLELLFRECNAALPNYLQKAVQAINEKYLTNKKIEKLAYSYQSDFKTKSKKLANLKPS